MASGWFKRRPRPAPSGETSVAEGSWLPCPQFKELLFVPELSRQHQVCMSCGYHFRLSARERLDLLLDEGSFRELDADLETTDPLQFRGYAESLRRYQAKTGMKEAVLTGEGSISGQPVVMGVTDSRFLMGSMASVVGEKLTRAVERATAQRCPALLVSDSGGGARMHEGLLSLMQMLKTAGALARHHEAGLLSIILLTDPSMAGVLASWASLGDVILAEPGAMVGFTGQRVAKQAGVSKVPKDFQTAEFQVAHGQVDAVTPRRELRDTLTALLSFGQPAPQPEAIHAG